MKISKSQSLMLSAFAGVASLALASGQQYDCSDAAGDGGHIVAIYQNGHVEVQENNIAGAQSLVSFDNCVKPAHHGPAIADGVSTFLSCSKADWKMTVTQGGFAGWTLASLKKGDRAVFSNLHCRFVSDHPDRSTGSTGGNAPNPVGDDTGTGNRSLPPPANPQAVAIQAFRDFNLSADQDAAKVLKGFAQAGLTEVGATDALAIDSGCGFAGCDVTFLVTTEYSSTGANTRSDSLMGLVHYSSVDKKAKLVRIIPTSQLRK